MAGASASGGRRQLRSLDNGSLEVTQSMDDDPLLDAPLLPRHTLHSRLHPEFCAIPTVFVANVLLLLHVTFVVLAFVTGVICSYADSSEDTCPENYTYPFKVQTTIIIAKVILWILHLLLERYIHFHHSKARSKGYLRIYRTTRHLKRVPLLIQSTGNVALLLIVSLQHSFPNHNKMYLCFTLGILAMELICSLICLVVYTVKVSNFNQAKPRPDIIEEERMYSYPNQVTSEVGFREISSLEEVVEKQGDVIEYLQRHNALLSKRLLTLMSEQNRS
ncbi:transmembrane protein 192 [Protobothrops mucrosquamatus]|uniref:transmembrane protein 192 n=1 Tax=Protobothrops mucrosquamatus TaxID=103944 RepID=UPI000775D81D|nr:transmembrane protein 192 [Protobothrops mucrosquamatus]